MLSLGRFVPPDPPEKWVTADHCTTENARMWRLVVITSANPISYAVAIAIIVVTMKLCALL
jgi:uncharacterized membrane protein YdfJ with MMPL/SSD domain